MQKWHVTELPQMDTDKRLNNTVDITLGASIHFRFYHFQSEAQNAESLTSESIQRLCSVQASISS